MRIGSLFSGIGGLELGLERAGLGHVVWQCEIDPFCRSVLTKHWPQVTRYEDVQSLRGDALPPVDVLCGGFPCQDVSGAGKGAGLAGARSGLWYEYLRLVGEFLPPVVIVENVASGAKRWLPHVRADLEVLGYDTRAYPLSAADVGAPHLRKRIFVVAYGYGVRVAEQWQPGGRQDGLRHGGTAEPLHDGAALAHGHGHGHGHGREGERRSGLLDGERAAQRHDTDGSGGAAVADTYGQGLEGRGLRECGRAGERPAGPGECDVADTACERRREGRAESEPQGQTSPARASPFPPGPDDMLAWGALQEKAQPSICRVTHGVPRGLDRQRLKALGNAVVPQCAEVIGRIILDRLCQPE